MSPAIDERRREIEALCRRCCVRHLDLFGSAATGREREGKSDLDSLVELESLPPGGYADAYFGLLESLHGLFGRPADLVVASAIRSRYFLHAVERTKTQVYAA